MEANEEFGETGDAGDEGDSRRRSKRSLVLLAAKIKGAHGEIDVRLRNLSQTGALLETTAEKIPPCGANVVFERGSTIVASKIAWVHGTRFGVQFNEPIEESEVLVHVGKTTHKAEPKASVTFRRTGFTNPKLSPTEQKIAQAWVKRVGPTATGD